MYCNKQLNIEKNLYLINTILQLAIFTINNYILYNYQNSPKNLFFKQISETLFPLYPLLKDNLLNFMIDTIDSSKSEHIRYFIYLIGQDRALNEEKDIDRSIISVNNETVQTYFFETENPKKISLNLLKRVKFILIHFLGYCY